MVATRFVAALVRCCREYAQRGDTPLAYGDFGERARINRASHAETERRAHPAMIHGQAAGERKRPRSRRGHVDEARARLITCQGSSLLVRQISIYRTDCALSSDAARPGIKVSDARDTQTRSTGERRQDLGSYRPMQRLLVVRRMNHNPVDQHRAHLHEPVEPLLTALLGGGAKSRTHTVDRPDLRCRTGDGLGPSPVDQLHTDSWRILRVRRGPRRLARAPTASGWLCRHAAFQRSQRRPRWPPCCC